jgi:signal transduction histidine kinase
MCAFASRVRCSQQTIVVLLIGLAATGLVWQRSVHDANTALAARLDDRAERISTAVRDRFNESEQMLQTARALFNASDHISSNDWGVFIDGLNIGKNTPGIFALGFVERVPSDGLGAFVERVRAEGAHGFSVRPHAGADRELGSQQEHYIVRYAEPMDRNHAALGVDIATYSRNALAYEDSAASGQTRIAAGFTLTQAPDSGPGFVMALPVYRSGTAAAEQSPDKVSGWVTAAMHIDKMITGSDDIAMDGFLLTLDIYHETDARQRQRLFASQPGQNGTAASLADPDAARDRFMEVFGRSMRLTLTPASADLVRPDTAVATVTLVIGSLATGLLALVTWSTTRTRSRAVRLALQMTNSLRISESRQRELAERAEQSNRAKSDFLANMSHEIRTPMTAILGYADVLGSGENDAEMVAESVDSIRHAGRHLLTIINDVLDLSKIESGRITFEQSPCDLRDLIQSALATLGPLATAKNISLRASLDTAVPAGVLTDQGRVRQVLINLVGNAVKFTDSGCISVLVAHRDGVLELAVHDTGVGIASDQLDRIFLAFEQGDNSASRQHQGTGLGLAISRRIAEMLGGGLDARSTPGEGSVFTLRIPASASPGAEMLTSLIRLAEAPPDAPETTRPAPATLHGRVLLAEDGRTISGSSRSSCARPGLRSRWSPTDARRWSSWSRAGRST